METNNSTYTPGTDAMTLAETVLNERKSVYERDADALLMMVIKFFQTNPYNNSVCIEKDGNKFTVGVVKTSYTFHSEVLKILKEKVNCLKGYIGYFSPEKVRTESCIYVRVDYKES